MSLTSGTRNNYLYRVRKLIEAYPKIRDEKEKRLCAEEIDRLLNKLGIDYDSAALQPKLGRPRTKADLTTVNEQGKQLTAEEREKELHEMERLAEEQKKEKQAKLDRMVEESKKRLEEEKKERKTAEKQTDDPTQAGEERRD